MSDLSGELPKALSASDRESFAYPTLKDRVPIILCKVIDLLHRQRLPLGIKDTNALKAVIEKIVSSRSCFSIVDYVI